ncbi:hypothetical protein [Bradyrhizobium cenepequi]|uniref:hypothetical protein n=1 Tax=Bradyrhizobium cenepequi TaxID=2821403 RepID=UPI001CE3250A|nr:hypothetical protein [Bradyrhizobium cenepequi]MCA6106168.1 hypothetical protein [Bradyrhizobium cenepequi]
MEEVIDFYRERPLPPRPALKADFAQKALKHRRKKLIGLIGAQEKPPFNIGRIAAKQSAVLGRDIGRQILPPGKKRTAATSFQIQHPSRKLL